MARRPLDPLRPLTEEERGWLEKLSRSAAAPAAEVARAKELLAVASGASYTAAAQAAGRRSGDAVSHLVSHFNREGLAALESRHGGGAPARYTSVERAQILAEVQRRPDREQDGTATWSLGTLKRSLRRAGLPRLSTSTIHEVLHAAGYSWQRDRSWCQTGHGLHPWLKAELREILAGLPPPRLRSAEEGRAQWQRWQEGLRVRFTLLEELPPLRRLLVWDNLAGHCSAELLCWRMVHGVMVRYTPLGGSWLGGPVHGEAMQCHLAESIQRILVRRALSGTHPQGPGEIIQALESVARAWTRAPTSFTWGGRHRRRRERARQRRHRLGGSAACTRHVVHRRRPGVLQQWRLTSQLTH